MSDQEKVFAGYFEPLKKWNDSTRQFEEFNESIVGKFNFTVNELDDLKKYATNPKDTTKPRRVYFELKTSKSGKVYAEVNDPSTWTQKSNTQSAPANNAPQGQQPSAAFEGADDLPF